MEKFYRRRQRNASEGTAARIRNTQNALNFATLAWLIVFFACPVYASNNSSIRQSTAESSSRRVNHIEVNNLSALLGHDTSYVPSSTLQVDYGNNHPFERRQTRRQASNNMDVPINNLDGIEYDYEAYEPIRIKLITDPIEQQRGKNYFLDVAIDNVLENVLPKAVKKWSQHLSVYPTKSAIPVKGASECFGLAGNNFVERQVHNADLVIIVTAYYEGITDAETGETLTLCGEGTLAMAAPCQLDQWDRPVVGLINFCFGDEIRQRSSPTDDVYSYIRNQFRINYSNDNTASGHSDFPAVNFRNSHITDEMVHVAATHEIGHVLGMISWLYKFYRNPDGTPQTSRPFQKTTQTCPDGSTTEGVFPSQDTVQLIPNTDYNSVVAGQYRNPYSFQIVTPRVQQVVRNHFQCESLTGARLSNPRAMLQRSGLAADESMQNSACLGSHWHENDYYGELMGPSVSGSSENALSPLTLALLDDSGWYKVNYQNAETTVYGLNAGCEFVQEPCIQYDKVPEYGNGFFCDVPMKFDAADDVNGSTSTLSEESLNAIGCDPSHHQWTVCDLWDESSLPWKQLDALKYHDRYFRNHPEYVSFFSLGDSCPIPDFSLGLDCTREDENYVGVYEGEVVGSESRCFNAFSTEDSPASVVTASLSRAAGMSSPSGFSLAQRTQRPACMKMVCDENLRAVRIIQNEKENICSHDGQIILLASSSSSSNGLNQFIECPRLSSVCPELFACPAGCSGRGICKMNEGGGEPKCECFDEEETEGDGCYPIHGPSRSGADGEGSNKSDAAVFDSPGWWLTAFFIAIFYGSR